MVTVTFMQYEAPLIRSAKRKVENLNAIFGLPETYRRGHGLSMTLGSDLKLRGGSLREGPERPFCTSCASGNSQGMLVLDGKGLRHGKG